MEVEAGLCKLRAWRPGDEPSLAKYANNRKVWINLRDIFPYPYTVDHASAWVDSVKDITPVTAFAIADSDEAIGGIGLTLLNDVHRRSAEVGFWLGEPHWGKGIASSALLALTEYAFANFDLVRLQANAFEWNRASARVLEKCGFIREGRLRKSATKDGHTIDEFLYALALD